MYWNIAKIAGGAAIGALNSNIRCIEMLKQAIEVSDLECWIVTLDVLKW